MATLLGTKIKDTYEGLLKLIDNAGLTATNKSVTDGTGAETGLKLGTGDTVEVTKRVSQTGLGQSTFFGENAGLNDNGVGSVSVAVGRRALESNVSAYNNVAVGRESLMNCVNSDNTGVGARALMNATTGTSNTAVGRFALDGLTTGNNNIGIGNIALDGVTTGSQNVSVGDYSLRNSSKNFNTAIGTDAGAGGYNFANGTFLGWRAGLGASGNNQTVIGSGAVGNGTNTVTLGDTNVTELHLAKAGASIALRSPNGTVFKLSVSDAGALVIT